MASVDHTRARGHADSDSPELRPAPARASTEAGKHLRKAEAALRKGQPHKALNHYRSASALTTREPRLGQAVGELGFKLGDYDGCLATLQRFIDHAGEAPSALNLMGNAWLRKGSPQAAIRFHERALASSAHEPKLWHDLATAYLHLGNAASAAMGYGEVVRLCPEARKAHYNLGTALLTAGHFAEAEEALLAATQREPGHAESHMNLGIARQRQGHLDDALHAQRTALRLRPHDPEVAWNLALSELLAGELKSGFARFEERLRLKGHPLSNRRLWDGRPLTDEPLVLMGEQGLGDTLQFLRFAKRAASRCPQSVIECRADLLPLLQRTFTGGIPVRPFGACEEENPWTASLMSLPHLLEATDDLMADGPYLELDSGRVAHYRAILPADRLCVGLNWQGNPSYRADRQRSMPLGELAPLWGVPRCSFFSLQHGPGREQLAEVRAQNLIDWGGTLDPPLAAFVETAHALGALHLLITTDTAIAHLAGALGTPVWLLLAHVPDFRWGLVGNRWYPSMRIFRQPRDGDWASVVAEVVPQLQGLAAQRGEA